MAQFSLTMPDDRANMMSNMMLIGRSLYAVAFIGFGVLCLAFVDFVNSLQPVPAMVPGFGLLAIVTGLILTLAGLAMLAGRWVRHAALVVAGFLALWIVALHIPGAFAEPGLLRSPFWIRVFECAGLAGAALILAGGSGDPVRASWVRLGRTLFGLSLPVFGILHFVYPQSIAVLVGGSPVSYPWPMFWAYLTGAGHFAAGVAIVSGVWSRLAATLAGLMYASWALTLHLPRVLSDLPARTAENPAGYGGDRAEITSLFVCVAFWGAAWIVAASLAQQPPGRSMATR